MYDHYQQLIQYIRQHLDAGHSVDAIRQTLLSAGWDSTMVDGALTAVTTPQTLDPQPLSYNTPAQPQPYQEQSDAPKKYRVFRAIKDTARAIRNSPFKILLSLVFSSIVGIFFGFLIFTLLGTAIISQIGVTPALPILTMLYAFLITFTILYFAWYTLTYGFITAIMSLALKDGADNGSTSFMQLIKQSAARTLRVAGANALSAVVIAGPLILSALIGLVVALASHRRNSLGILFVSLVLQTAATVWILLGILRYTLVPYVALFEPDIPLRKTLGRSKFLLAHGGQWFLIKGFFLILAVGIIVGIAGRGNTLQNLPQPVIIALSILMIMLSAFFNGSMLMLYLNRKAVKG